ncbi:hypothetical protein NDU88_007805 [Pleurodeles waltl]|uniref:Uncharacterized protein n=1 Tax=Pleurodeles waltl TaxID=8319 RepID=A0AAV7RQI0_PLEWA|nr:hypothetical protein NDU88_007805 [Pleurodeles waltl]
MRTGDNEEVGEEAILDHHGLFRAQLEGVLSWGRQGEHTELEVQGDAMWDEEVQAVPIIDVDRVIAEREKDGIYGERSLDREEGPALALVAALLEWSEDEWHCRPPTKVYSRGSGLKESVEKSLKVGVARTRVPSSGRLGEDETGWGGDLSEVRADSIDVFERGKASTPGPLFSSFLQQGLAGTSQSSRELGAAQHTRGEDKAELGAASWIYKGSERSTGFIDSEVVRVPWGGKSSAPAGVSRYQQSTGRMTWWESRSTAATRRPSMAIQHTPAEPYIYAEEQPGPSGMATQDFSGHTGLDSDEYSLEEGEVWEKDGAQKREVEWWQKEKSQKVRGGGWMILLFIFYRGHAPVVKAFGEVLQKGKSWQGRRVMSGH